MESITAALINERVFYQCCKFEVVIYFSIGTKLENCYEVWSQCQPTHVRKIIKRIRQNMWMNGGTYIKKNQKQDI